MIDKSLVTGSTTMLVLQLLEQRDMYGYQMIEVLSRKSNNVFELKAGTLYPLLHSLDKNGMIDSYEQEANGRLRKYYKLTEDGRKFLSDKKQEWNVYVDAIAKVITEA